MTERSRNPKTRTTRRPPRVSAAEARAAEESRAGARRAQVAAELAAHFAGGVPGRWMLTVSWAAAASTAVVGIIALWTTDGAGGRGVWGSVYFAVTVAWFLAGLVACVAGFLAAAGRTRTHRLSIGSLVVLTGVAPRRVRASLWGAVLAQTLAGVVPAAMSTDLRLEFGSLVPLLGIALVFWWGAAHGRFPPLAAPARPPAGGRAAGTSSRPRS